MCIFHHGPHKRSSVMVDGIVVLVVGVLWFMTNYEIMDSEFWTWLLPGLVILCGLRILLMPMCPCPECVKDRNQKEPS